MRKFALLTIISFLLATNTSSGITRYPYIEGTASWYADFSPGVLKTTANMETFEHERLTCAMWNIPFGTKLEVQDLETGRSVIVRVNDRGPARRLCRKGRVIDLTMGAFQNIADLDKGLTRVRVRILE